VNDKDGAAGTLDILTADAHSPTVAFADFDRRARLGERMQVAFFGASLTWGANASDPLRTSYRARVAEWMEAHYPEARFRYTDGAIGGTGSDLGVFRLQRDCLAHRPDLVFLDFSANDDIRNPNAERLAAYESLVRRIVTEGCCPLVIVMFPFKWDASPGTAGTMAGRLAHKRIAEAYGVPVGDAILAIQELTAADPSVPDRLWVLDGAHPVDEGYTLFAQAACQAFQEAVEQRAVCSAPATMLHGDTYMTWSRNRLSRLKSLPSGWTPALASRTSAWFDGLMSRWLDDVVVCRNIEVGRDPVTGQEIRTPVPVVPLRVSFRARCVLVFGEETVNSGKYRAVIDGKRVEHRQAGAVSHEYDLSSKRCGGGRQHYALLVTGLDPAVEHTLVLQPVFAKDEVQELRLESLCLAGGEARLVDCGRPVVNTAACRGKGQACHG